MPLDLGGFATNHATNPGPLILTDTSIALMAHEVKHQTLFDIPPGCTGELYVLNSVREYTNTKAKVPASLMLLYHACLTSTILADKPSTSDDHMVSAWAQPTATHTQCI